MEGPFILFVWGPQRVLPVRLTSLSITEEAYDPLLNPIRAKAELSLNVLSYHDLGVLHPGHWLFLAHQMAKEVRGHDERRQQRAERRTRGSAMNPIRRDRVSADQPLPRHRDGDARARRRHVEIVYLRRRFLPPSDRFTLIAGARGHAGGPPGQHHRAVPGRSAAVLADLRCQRRDEPAGADGRDRPAAADHACRKAFRACRMLVSGAYLTLLIGPAVPLPAPLPVMEALQSVQVNTVRAIAAGFQLTFTLGKTSLLQTGAAAGGLLRSDHHARRHRRHAQRHPERADGRLRHAPGDAAGQRAGPVDADDHRRGPDGGDGSVEITLSYPAMPDVAQVKLHPRASTRFSGIVPVVVPPFIFTVEDADSSGWITQTGTDLQHIRGLAQAERLSCSTSSPVRCRPEHRLLRPGRARAAAAAGAEREHGRPHQRRVAQLQPRRAARSGWRSSPSSIRSTGRDSDAGADAGHQHLQAAARPAPDAAGQDRVRPRVGGLELRRSAQAGDRTRHRIVGADHRQRHARTCCATARCCGRGRSSACAAPASTYDGLYYVDSVTHNIKRANTSRASSCRATA